MPAWVNYHDNNKDKDNSQEILNNTNASSYY